MIKKYNITVDDKEVLQLKAELDSRAGIFAAKETVIPSVFKQYLSNAYDTDFYNKLFGAEKNYCEIQNEIFKLEAKDSLTEDEQNMLDELVAKRTELESEYAYLADLRNNNFEDKNDMMGGSLYPSPDYNTNLAEDEYYKDEAKSFIKRAFEAVYTKPYTTTTTTNPLKIDVRKESLDAFKNLYDIGVLAGKSGTDLVKIRDYDNIVREITYDDLHAMVIEVGAYFQSKYEWKWTNQEAVEAAFTFADIIAVIDNM